MFRAGKWRFRTIRHGIIEMNWISVWFGMPSKRFSRKRKFSSTDRKIMDLLTIDPIWMLTLIWVRKCHTLRLNVQIFQQQRTFFSILHRRSLVQFATNQKYYGREKDDGGTKTEEGQIQLEKCVRRSSVGFVSVGTGHQRSAWCKLHIFVRHGIVCGGELSHQGLHQSIANRWDFITHASLITVHDKRFLFTAHSMILFLKNWQREIQQNESNAFDFSTYQLTILVLWYFQLWKYLPSVKSLQSSANKLYCGGMWTQTKKNTKFSSWKFENALFPALTFRRTNWLQETNQDHQTDDQSTERLRAGVFRFLWKSVQSTQGPNLGVLWQIAEEKLYQSRRYR